MVPDICFDAGRREKSPASVRLRLLQLVCPCVNLGLHAVNVASLASATTSAPLTTALGTCYDEFRPFAVKLLARPVRTAVVIFASAVCPP